MIDAKPLKKRMYTDLFKVIESLDGELYKKYKKIQGEWSERQFSLKIYKTASSPTSPPSYLSIKVPWLYTHCPVRFYDDKEKKIALSDYLLRKFSKFSKKVSSRDNVGKSGVFYPDQMGSEILERSSIYFDPTYIELKFRYGLPARGNRIDAKKMKSMLEISVPLIIETILDFNHHDHEKIETHINYYKDHEFLRKELKKRKLVSFIPYGAILPREKRGQPGPLKKAVPFKGPKSLEVKIKLPSNRTIIGCGIPMGVTIITGAGFHGKTTLLESIVQGIYNHIPGDGRDYLVTDQNSFKVNTENGREAKGLDLRPYINHLPLSQKTVFFNSMNCSGSTSQASTVIESIRMNAKLLLFDEDSSATNFLYCDAKMSDFIGKNDQTITPYLHSARHLFETHKVSSILVLGSNYDSIQYADHLIKLSSFEAYDASDQISPKESKTIEFTPSESISKRRPVDSNHFKIKKRLKPMNGQVMSKHHIEIGAIPLKFYDNEQIIDIGQAKTILSLIFELESIIYKKSITLEKAILKLFENFQLNSHSEYSEGMVMIRPIDFAHALNRFKMLKIKPSEGR